jgi:hypothetical protein
MMYPCAIFRSEQPHHKDEAHLDLVDQIFALRQSGGWKEIDRLIAHIFDKTFSEFADEVTSRIHYSLDDPGLGGARIYQLEFLTPFSIPHVCFGSTASFATEHLMQTLLKVQQETKKTGVTPRAIRLCSGASRYFEVPLAHGLEDVCNPGNGEHPFQISFHLNWEGLSIGRKEHSVMLSLLKLAPKSEHNRIKGEFLEDELGL